MEKLANKDYKKLRTFIKTNHLKEIFKTSNFILFFYYDFFNSTARITLRKQIADETASSLILKNTQIRRLLKKNNYKKLQHLFLGQTLLIFNKLEKNNNKNFWKDFLKQPKLKLIGSFWNNNFYKTKKTEQILNLTEQIRLKNLMLLNLPLYNLKNLLNNIKIVK